VENRYREAAEGAAAWLRSTALTTGDVTAWPATPTVSSDLEASLGWGALGPMVFFAQLARSGDEAALDLAVRGARWVEERLASDDELEPGLFTGLAGFAVVFNELGKAGPHTSDQVVSVIDRLGRTAITADNGANWAETTEVLWGTAGIGFTLLSIGAPLVGAPAVDLAARAGDWLLAVAHRVPEGLRWDLGQGTAARYPLGTRIWFPNFAHGTAGIAAYLARLGAATNEDRFLEAARRGAAWVLSTCRTDGGGCAARHHDPEATRDRPIGMGPTRDPADASPMYTMGWCHGPPGLSWLFRELQLATGEDEWASWIARTARTVRESGLPRRLEPGFWDNVGRCCGSAGVIEYFLDLHTWRDDPEDLAFALAVADDMVERATVDGEGTRWSNVEFRQTPPELPPETTFYQGASGIGLTLLRLGRHLRGEPTTVEWPHRPAW
jgi:lantibiotic modifying enzyme